MGHEHYYTEWYKPHWWSIPRFRCKCGKEI